MVGEMMQQYQTEEQKPGMEEIEKKVEDIKSKNLKSTSPSAKQQFDQKIKITFEDFIEINDTV
jgi:hypothetical protein